MFTLKITLILVHTLLIHVASVLNVHRLKALLIALTAHVVIRIHEAILVGHVTTVRVIIEWCILLLLISDGRLVMKRLIGHVLTGMLSRLVVIATRIEVRSVF